jgi:hypothetical protein
MKFLPTILKPAIPMLKDNHIPDQNIHGSISIDENHEIDKIYLFLNQNLKTFKTTDKVLVHCDFCPDNSLVDAQHRLKCVFDFVNVTVSTRYLEFTPLYQPKYMELLKLVIEEYESLTHIKIDLTYLKYLKLTKLLSSINYLFKNPKLNFKLQNAWENRIEQIKHLSQNIK